MPDLSDRSPTARFTGLSSLYAQYRPDYPEEAAEHIVEQCSLRTEAVIVDVGCGTGISTRWLARRGFRMIGIEPNAEMRARAASEPMEGGAPAPDYRQGRAEATGLDDGVADLVLCAQAFHWFEPQAALREFHRILKPDGWVALVWNERDDNDSFTAAYGSVIRKLPEALAVEVPRGRAGDRLHESPLLRKAKKAVFKHHQNLDLDGVLGRAFSASYAPKEPLAAERFAGELAEVFQQYQENGLVTLRYETSVYLGQRAGAG
jgi:ubiquinone/menaquinone biosynthesis C-methylase UbiE